MKTCSQNFLTPQLTLYVFLEFLNNNKKKNSLLSLHLGSDHKDLLLRLNQDLLRATETQESLPNPSIHIALRLSTQHNLSKEAQYLNQLKTKFHADIQRYWPVQPYLYTLAVWNFPIGVNTCHMVACDGVTSLPGSIPASCPVIRASDPPKPWLKKINHSRNHYSVLCKCCNRSLRSSCVETPETLSLVTLYTKVWCRWRFFVPPNQKPHVICCTLRLNKLAVNLTHHHPPHTMEPLSL